MAKWQFQFLRCNVKTNKKINCISSGVGGRGLCVGEAGFKPKQVKQP